MHVLLFAMYTNEKYFMIYYIIIIYDRQYLAIKIGIIKLSITKILLFKNNINIFLKMKSKICFFL